MFLNPLAVNKKLMNVKVIFNYRFAGGNKVFFFIILANATRDCSS